MATRSTIALEFADGTVESVYCHWDGYLDHNGVILRDHYSDPFKLQKLIDIGDLSSLGPEIGSKHDFDDLSSKNECTFYTRDRAEADAVKRKYATYAEYREKLDYQDYNYILRQVKGKAVWFVYSWTDLDCTLEEAILKEKVAEDM